MLLSDLPRFEIGADRARAARLSLTADGFRFAAPQVGKTVHHCVCKVNPQDYVGGLSILVTVDA